MENRVDFPRFRELLHVLENSGTLIRVRLSGEGWMADSKLILLSESAMILQDERDHKTIVNLRNVVEFQLEKAVLGFTAEGLYEVGC